MVERKLRVANGSCSNSITSRLATNIRVTALLSNQMDSLAQTARGWYIYAIYYRRRAAGTLRTRTNPIHGWRPSLKLALCDVTIVLCRSARLSVVLSRITEGGLLRRWLPSVGRPVVGRSEMFVWVFTAYTLRAFPLRVLYARIVTLTSFSLGSRQDHRVADGMRRVMLA
jgi:hypothetical protein